MGRIITHETGIFKGKICLGFFEDIISPSPNNEWIHLGFSGFSPEEIKETFLLKQGKIIKTHLEELKKMGLKRASINEILEVLVKQAEDTSGYFNLKDKLPETIYPRAAINLISTTPEPTPSKVYKELAPVYNRTLVDLTFPRRCN